MHDQKSGARPNSDCDCDKDPIAGLKQMFVDEVQARRLAAGQSPARRPVFLRLHGVAHATLHLSESMPEEWRVGLFGGPATRTAWVRFSSDLPDGLPDLESTCGVGIKLFGVPGAKALAPKEEGDTADLIFQNHDVFFVDDARDMCAFTKASLTSKDAGDAWLREHPETGRILDDMKKRVDSVLATDYWSVIPFALGDGRHCKYKLEPIEAAESDAPDLQDPNYLAVDLASRLRAGPARFRLMVQIQKDPQQMPIDRATVRWCEQSSPPVEVGVLEIPQQDVETRGQAEYGETLAFNPWRVPPENAPVGSIAEARKVVYRASAERRRNVQGEPVGEPREPRPVEDYPAAVDTRIVRAAIHPAIGVARIGNAVEECFVGPEIVPAPVPEGGFRDPSGAIKRQAARFRVFGYNAAGQVVKELGLGDAKIEWQVHLVNRKAEWYRFDRAMDIPEAAATECLRRNAALQGSDREALVIDPGPRSISGAKTVGDAYAFGDGEFLGVKVYLGELRTDEAGRLLVLGGRGVSASPAGRPIYDPSNPATFNNADGWHDDTGDGPVTARVTIAGRDVPVEPAWVIVAPPDFSPSTLGWRTMHDLVTDTFVEAGRLPMPEQVSFSRDVQPVLQRLGGLQWVNAGFAAMFGHGGPISFDHPQLLARLSSRDPSEQELRRTILNSFRPVDPKGADPRPWPWIYGDAFGTGVKDSPRQNLPLSAVRYRMLQTWVEGRHVDDFAPDRCPPSGLGDLTLAEQPAMLDRAALDYCLADAFHPGCEVTWPMRHATMYSAPYRIRHRRPDDPEPDLGPKLTQPEALAVDGPLYGQRPGDLTRWMALPWQADTAFCRSGYDQDYDPYLPTFWPARVPNQVLTEEQYRAAVDPDKTPAERAAAFRTREGWLRTIQDLGTVAAMEHMVAHFGEQGILEERPGPEGDPEIPSRMLVEVRPGTAPSVQPLEEPENEKQRALRRAGWRDEAQYREYCRVRSAGRES